MQTIEKFLVATAICLRCREVTGQGDQGFLIAERRAAKQYLCELHGSRGDPPVRKMMGSDNGPPNMADVVDTVAAEAAVVEETRCYEAWAERMGFDPDSRRGEQIYRTERRQARVLRALLGGEGYRKLLWETERL
jgi:hypothetical protein